MSYLHKLDVFIEDDGQIRPFLLFITAPKKMPDTDDYFCNIHAPAVLKQDKRIYGINTEQAAELAIKFVNELLSGRRLVDENGKPVIL